MKIPKKIKITGVDIDIKMVDKPIECSNLCRGLAKIEECEIQLQKELNPRRLKQTFLHECIHFIDEEHDIGLGERVVNLLGIEILRLIEENKLNFLD